METALADEVSEDRLHELTEEFLWRLRHIEGPLNEAELEEMESEFKEIIALTLRSAARDTS